MSITMVVSVVWIFMQLKLVRCIAVRLLVLLQHSSSLCTHLCSKRLSYDQRILALICRLRTGCYNLATGCYALAAVRYRWKFPGMISPWALPYRDCSLVWNFHIMGRDGRLWLVVGAGTSTLYKHHSRRSVIHQLLSAYSSKLLCQIK